MCKSGVCVARSVFDEGCNGLPVLVMNVTDSPIILDPDTVLSDLIPVECVSKPTEVRDQSKLHDAVELIVGKVDSTVTETEKDSLREVLYRYSNVISLGEFDIGLTDLIEHEIDTGMAKPVKQALRRQPYVYLPKIDEHVDQMIKAGWVVPVNSPWSTNIVCVKKADGSIRYCTDMRKLNDLTKKDSYPLPNITSCLEALSGAKFYSSVDLANAFHQIRIKSSDVDKTTFVTRTGSYAYKRMCFGLSNATATFSRLIDLVMKGLHYSIAVLYLDDILVYAQDASSMIERIELVLQRLQAANLKVKPSKCNFLQTEVTFLGFQINQKGISTCPSKVKEIVEWPVPINAQEVKSFLGLASYYRKFIKGFSDIVASLNRLTSTGVKFDWTQDCQQAFETLKIRLSSAPVLGLPRDGGNYILDTDASQKALGGVLSQVQDQQEVVICYSSRTLTSSERNYCTTRQEMLSVIHFLKKFRCYLLGNHFRLRTDHAALTYLQRTPELHGQQARWLEITQDYNFTIEHRPGIKHGNADALSRRPCRQCGLGEITEPNISIAAVKTAVKDANLIADDNMESGEIGREQMQEATAADPDLKAFCELFAENTGERTSWDVMISRSPLQKTLWTQWSRLKLEGGILYRQWFHTDGFHSHWQTVVPAVLQNAVLALAHKGLRGHFGAHRTQQQFQRRAYWPGWSNDVNKFCAACQECARFIQGKPRRQGLLQSMQVGAPFERMSVDITGPHPRSSKGHVYILTILDHFSKWGDAYPLRNKEAITVARVLVDQFFTRYGGLGMSILTDQGKEFCNALLNEVCKMFNVDKLRTSAYKASTNGAVERWHRTLNAMIGKVVADNQKDWDVHLPFLLCAYRSARHESTGFSPNMLIFGRELIAPIDLVCGLPESEHEAYNSASDFVAKRRELLDNAFNLVRRHLKTSVDRNKHYYDMRVKPNEFDVGQFVLYYYPRKYVGRSPKWQKFFVGPFLILKVLGPNSYLIQRSQRAVPIVTHVDKLKAYLGPPLVAWLPKPALSAGDENSNNNNAVLTCSLMLCDYDVVCVLLNCSMDKPWGNKFEERRHISPPRNRRGSRQSPHFRSPRPPLTYEQNKAHYQWRGRGTEAHRGETRSPRPVVSRRGSERDSKSREDCHSRHKPYSKDACSRRDWHHRDEFWQGRDNRYREQRHRSRSSSDSRGKDSHSPTDAVQSSRRRGQPETVKSKVIVSPIRCRAASLDSVWERKPVASKIVNNRNEGTREPAGKGKERVRVEDLPRPMLPPLKADSRLVTANNSPGKTDKRRPEGSRSSTSSSRESGSRTGHKEAESEMGDAQCCCVSEPSPEEKAALTTAKKTLEDLGMTPAEQAEFCTAALRLIGSQPMVLKLASKMASEQVARHHSAQSTSNAGPTVPLAIVCSLLAQMSAELECDLPPCAKEVAAMLYEQYGQAEVDAVWVHLERAAKLQGLYEQRQFEKRRNQAMRVPPKATKSTESGPPPVSEDRAKQRT